MAKNLFGKARKVGNAYVVLDGGGWRWHILKLYKSPEASMKDGHARAFCYVEGIEKEYGDVYLREIPGAERWLRDMVFLGASESEVASMKNPVVAA